MFGLTSQPTPTLFTPTQTTGIGASQPNITSDTVFTDLPDPIKQELAKIQTYINEEKNAMEEVSHRNPELILRVTSEIVLIREKLTSLLYALDADLSSIQNFKKEVTAELKNAELAVRTIERMRSPVTANLQLNYSPPPPYFIHLAESFEKRMREYAQRIDEVQQYLLYSSGKNYSPQMLQDILLHQHELFLSLAARVAVLHENVADLRASYLNYLKKYHSDYHDPFAEAEQRRKRKSFLTRELPKQLLSVAPTATPSTAFGSTTGGSLFGGTGLGSTPSMITPATGGLFGSTIPSTTGTTFGTTPSTGGMFGTTTTPATGGLFGATPNTSPALGTTPSTTFGTVPTLGAAPTFGGLGGTAFGITSSPTPVGDSKKNKARNAASARKR